MFTACPAPASPRSPSTRSTPRGSGATWSRCRRTRDSSSARWRSPTSTSSRASPGDLDRPVHVAQPALDRRHDHRDLRLPARAVRARRTPALLQLRPTDRATDPDQIVDQVMELPEGTVPGPRPRRSRTQGRVRQAARRARAEGFVRIDGECGRRADPAGQDVQAHDRGRRRPARRQARHPAPRRRLHRDRARARRGHRIDRGPDARRGGSCRTSPIVGVHALRTLVRRDGPRNFSFNSRTARVRPATASARGSRSTPSSSCPMPRSLRARRRARALGERNARVLEPSARVCRRSPRHRPRHTVPRLAKKQRDVLLYGSDEQIHVRYKNRYGRQRSYWTTRGRGHQRRAASPRDRLRVPRDKLEQFMREIRAGRARCAPATRNPRGHRRRPEHRRTHRPLDPRHAHVRRHDRPQRARADDRGAPAQGDP